MLATREKPAAVVAFAGLVDLVGVFYERVQEVLPQVQDGFKAREKQFHQGKSIRKESELIDKGLLKPDAHDEVDMGSCICQDLAFRWGDDVEVFKRYSPKEQYRHIESPVLFVVGSKDNFRIAGKELVSNLQALGRIAEYSEHPEMELFEDQWRDRTRAVGWDIQFEYNGYDTKMILDATSYTVHASQQ